MTDIDDLKSSSDAIRIYASRLALKKAGTRRYECRCPFHNDHNPSFDVFRNDSGVWMWMCKSGCGSGNVIQFVERLDHVSFKEAVDLVKKAIGGSWSIKKNQVEKVFAPIFSAEKKASYKTYTLEQYAVFEKALAQNEKAKMWLLEERGITYETAQRLHLGFKPSIQSKQESLQDVLDKGWIVLPCIEGKKVVSIKYRSIARKAFARQPGMATALFNTETIDALEPVYLVAGEFDACVMEQAGYHAVSLPSDGMTLTPEMRDLIMEAKEVLLAGDSDSSGAKIMGKLRAELKDRTYLLEWPVGVKDANALLKKNPENFNNVVDAITVQALSQPMPGIYSMTEAMLASKRTNLSDHPDRLRFPWPAVDKMAILLPGSVMALFATNTKMGKTCFTENFTMYGAMFHNEVVLNYQCELSIDEMCNLMASQILNKDRNSITHADYVEASKAMAEHNTHYYVGRDPTLNTAGPVLDLIEAAIRRLGATVVVLDHIHFITRNEANQTEAEANTMQRIKRMSQELGVKFVVIGQPRKALQTNKGKAVHITDWKGSETGCSDADAIFAMHRDVVTGYDPANPPMDDYNPLTKIHLLGARAKGDGATEVALMFHGKTSNFRDVVPESAMPAGVAEGIFD